MGLVRGRQESAALEAMNLFSLFDDPAAMPGTPVTDPQRQAAFQALIGSELQQALATPSRVHGWRVQNLYEAVTVALGTVRLLKSEDDGAYYHDDAAKFTPPDFRIVTSDGQHLLVEAKNVAPREQGADQRMRTADLAAQARYAQATGARLMIAHYWAALNLWTMVDEQALSTVGTKRILSLTGAMQSSEMLILGDATTATVPPLCLSLAPADPIWVDGPQVEFTVASATVSCAGQPVTDLVRQPPFVIMAGFRG